MTPAYYPVLLTLLLITTISASNNACRNTFGLPFNLYIPKNSTSNLNHINCTTINQFDYGYEKDNTIPYIHMKCNFGYLNINNFYDHGTIFVNTSLPIFISQFDWKSIGDSNTYYIPESNETGVESVSNWLEYGFPDTVWPFMKNVYFVNIDVEYFKNSDAPYWRMAMLAVKEAEFVAIRLTTIAKIG